MKIKIILSIIIFLLVGNGYSQIPQSPNRINSKGLKDGEWTILFNENWKEINNLVGIKYYRKVTFLDGKPTGIVRDYYLSGKVFWEGKLKSVNPTVYDDGLCIWYFENGNIQTKIYYVNEKPNGEYKTYYLNGKESMSGFLKDGIRDQLFTYFYPNGNIFSKRTFHQDMIWDVLFTNDSLGNPLPTGDLKNGSGFYIDYYMSGKKSSEGEYKTGFKDGLWKEYGEDGSWWEGNYLKGEKEGEWVRRYSNGSSGGIKTYKNGVEQ